MKRSFRHIQEHRHCLAGNCSAGFLKPCLIKRQIALAKQLAEEGQPVPQIASTFDVQEVTTYRCLAADEDRP